MEAESYPTVTESHFTSEAFKADGKIPPAPLSGTAGVMHNYRLLLFSLEQKRLRTGSVLNLLSVLF